MKNACMSNTTVGPPNNGHVGDKHFVHCSKVVPSSELERQGANSLSIVGRLSTIQSVHYQRFHCILSHVHGGQNLPIVIHRLARAEL